MDLCRASALWAVLLAGSLGGAVAQDAPPGPPLLHPAEARAQSPVVTLDQARFFQGSAFGKAAEARAQTETTALATENRQIEAELETEERALTDRRAILSPEEFAPLAAEFDAKVERIRQEQDEKSRVIVRKLDEDRQRFFEAALPALTELMASTGAVAILSNETAILSLSSIDMTDEAIALMDKRLPASDPVADPSAPSPTPQP